jgi:hypothetical protein
MIDLPIIRYIRSIRHEKSKIKEKHIAEKLTKLKEVIEYDTWEIENGSHILILKKAYINQKKTANRKELRLRLLRQSTKSRI